MFVTGKIREFDLVDEHEIKQIIVLWLNANKLSLIVKKKSFN